MLHLDFLPVKAFLAAVDDVLNSNTILLSLPFISRLDAAEDWQRKLSEYLHSAVFSAAVFSYYMRRSRGAIRADEPKIFRPQNLPRFERIVKYRSYLAAMLVADWRTPIALNGYQMSFYSPYQKALPLKKAAGYVNAFLAALFAAGRVEAWALSTDFIAPASAFTHEERKKWMTYFDGDKGIPTDSATLFMDEERAYLLLTNGND